MRRVSTSSATAVRLDMSVRPGAGISLRIVPEQAIMAIVELGYQRFGGGV